MGTLQCEIRSRHERLCGRKRLAMGPTLVLGLVFVQIMSASCGVTAPRKAEEPENEVEKGLKMLYTTYQKCGETEDMFSCVKVKALKLADRALKINNIPIFEGMTVVRNDDAASRSLNVPEFRESELPQDPEKRQEALDDMIVDRVTRFLKTHSVQFDLPRILDEKSDVEEGRSKMKKMIGPLIMAAMMKGSMMAYALKAVGLLAAKALMVSKIALVLATIIGLKKLFSHGHHESKTIEIVQKPQISHAHTYSSGHDFGGFGGGGGGGGGGAGWESSGHGHSGGGGYGRSLDGSIPVASGKRSVDEIPVGKGVDNVVGRSFETGQEMAYRAQMPQGL